MNKQEKNIVDILTFDEIEDIVDIFIDKVYHTDKTVALITNKELVEYAMDVLLNDDCITVKRVDLELDSEYAEDVSVRFLVPLTERTSMEKQLLESFQGSAKTEIEDYGYYAKNGKELLLFEEEV